MKIVDGMILSQMGEDWVAVPTGDASEKLHGIVRINETGKVVWEGLSEGLAEEEIVSRLTERYDVDDATALASVQSVVATLSDAGLLV